MRKLSHDEISKNRVTVQTINSAKKFPVYIILNSIRSSYNVGSIFRTSDGAMIEKLFLCGYTPLPPNKELLKTALGSTESVIWEFEQDAKKVITDLKSKGIKICALELTDTSITHYNLSSEVFPICIVVGNEITGVPNDILELCDFSIEIPQYGIKQSLNVSVAYGIAVFELRRIFDAQIHTTEEK